jgi:hypothetical protein
MNRHRLHRGIDYRPGIDYHRLHRGECREAHLPLAVIVELRRQAEVAQPRPHLLPRPHLAHRRDEGHDVHLVRGGRAGRQAGGQQPPAYWQWLRSNATDRK